MDAMIIYYGASHHMVAWKYAPSSLKPYVGPPILMGYDSSVEAIRQGKVDLGDGSFKNFLHVLKL